MLRAALDVNTLVSGTITPAGPAGLMLRSWRAGAFTLVTCEAVIATYAAVLGRPKVRRAYPGITSETIVLAAAVLREFADLIEMPSLVPRMVPDDPEDDVLLQCAAAGGADYIVTGDREHLLPRGSHHGIPIVPPASFVAILAEDLAGRRRD